MKLLLATISTDNKYTEYALRSLYSVVSDSPIESVMKVYGEGDTVPGIYEDIFLGGYNIVYLHCDEYNERAVSSVAELVKKAIPDIAIVMGGAEVSYETRSYMKANPWVDYVIRGEGETTLYRFLKSLIDYEFDFEYIGGFAYRSGDSIIINNYDEPAELDDLPFVYDKTEADSSIIYYETIRGNTERTAYTQLLPDTGVRTLSLERICRELRYFLVKEPEKVVVFDSAFNYDPDRAYKVLEYLIGNDNGITTFEFNIDGEKLDEETVRLLAEAREGLFEFNIAVTSTNSAVLSAVGRRENIYELMYNVAKLLQNGNVKVNVSVTAGLPIETEKLFARSFNKAFGLCEGSPLKVNFVRMSKGTMLRHEADKYGYLYSSSAPYDVIATDTMSAGELIRIRQIARVVDAYVGNGGFKGTFSRILSDTNARAYDIFSKLTDFICSNGYADKLDDETQLASYLYSSVTDLYDEADNTLKLDLLKEAMRKDLGKPVIIEEITETQEEEDIED